MKSMSATAIIKHSLHNNKMSNRLIEFATNIWTVEGPTVSFFGFPYPTRMVVIRLVERVEPCAWIWSPIELSDDLAEEVKTKAGPMKYIVSPNKFHHFFLKEWADRYPKAEVFAPPGLDNRRVAEGIRFTSRFGVGEPAPDFANEIDHVIIKGSYVLQEVEFYHKPSKTIIINDLIQRHTENLEGWKGWLMKMDGLAGEEGSTPRDWRFTFWWPCGKAKLRVARDVMFGWNAEKMIIAHGLCVDTGASDIIRRALSWI